MGTCSRNLKASYSGKKLSDGGSIEGRGRLIGQVIHLLTRYYGNAIREYSDSHDKMSTAIWATFYHKSSTDTKLQHNLCPEAANSWCKWQQAKAKKSLKNFKYRSQYPNCDNESHQTNL